jgi:NADH:ubiquinone oxidoreductase subunit E
MNYPIIPIAVAEVSTKQRKREAPKGRRVDPVALAEVQGLLANESRRADLLIEHLHKIQDRFGHLSAAHLAALAQEMRMPQTSVYEVATFYHHFDIVKEGETAPAALTVRVCDGLSCELAGAKDLLAKLPALLGQEVRVIAAPCIGRCEQAPAAVVGQNPVPKATCESIAATVAAKAVKHMPSGFIDLAEYTATGGYELLGQCLSGERDVESVIKTMENSGLRGLGGAGFPSGRKWRIVKAEKALA